MDLADMDGDKAMLDACRAYARMINTLDYGALEPWLAEEMHYASQQVFDEMTSKRQYEPYMKKKLNAIRSSGSRVIAEIGYTSMGARRPCVLLSQKTEGVEATLLIKVREGMISRMDMCIVPSPAECERTGEFPI